MEQEIQNHPVVIATFDENVGRMVLGRVFTSILNDNQRYSAADQIRQVNLGTLRGDTARWR